ncbi:uncharacterized protein SCHCODRAFT_02604070 [Schizophyllum commune H4-8]|uniref:Expressed protein n=1 Tax=Schizophyllum commune (strain H4-8 / FGSC 9210) TaxID=578458 RepID=D8PUM2_SCHCM|nr:uncharacterized protein SCHCODRAFT_02604070 [Schizophyllum commune H4-8]KAI5899062.1 hypothetical protein SCHCODRAFT_02604070 [Schizophyllum commune H4-8]
MDLTLSTSDIMETVFSDGTGRALYRTHTNHPAVPHETALYRVASESGGDLRVGQVTLAGIRDHLVVVNGLDVTPVKKKKLSASQTFTASNGRSYKWKSNAMGSFTLVDDETKEDIATYERHSVLSSQSNSLHIEPFTVVGQRSAECRKAGIRTCVVLLCSAGRRSGA